MIMLSFRMILALAVPVGLMMAIWPTTPPAAILARPEAEARALTGQSHAAALILTRTRVATFDFTGNTLHIEDTRAIFLRRAKPRRLRFHRAGQSLAVQSQSPKGEWRTARSIPLDAIAKAPIDERDIDDEAPESTIKLAVKADFDDKADL